MSAAAADPRTAPDALTAAAHRTAAVLADRAATADRERRLAPDTVARLLTAGFARHFVPVRHGGAEGTFGDLARALRVVGGSCVSAAWVGLIHASSGRMAAFLPVAGQDEVWAGGPDAALSSALRPAGSATRSGGDWILSGRWDFLSGVRHADWSLLCVAGERPPDIRYFAVPRAQYRVAETWCATGMRATASDSVHLDGVRVPDARTFPHAALADGSDDPTTAACYRAPLPGCGPPLFAAPALGAATAALTRWARRRTARDATARLALTRGSAELDIAQLLLDRAVSAADTPPTDTGTVARTMRDAATAAHLIRDAVERIAGLSGSAMLAETDPLQRAWRDVRTAVSHGALDLDRSSTRYVRDVWGWTTDRP
ncbi:hypothetical protein [Streptomyces catenulae]|uniref:Hydrolase n=1 Tax=Streptomyces catenulae TaxID=66875 RepID=A0ABV2YZD2_9ACTN|nr:hypothetical protein [Streptomyces catenulae]